MPEKPSIEFLLQYPIEGRVDNPELAWDMAHAEKQLRDQAIGATALSERQGLLSQASQAASRAERAYYRGFGISGKKQLQQIMREYYLADHVGLYEELDTASDPAIREELMAKAEALRRKTGFTPEERRKDYVKSLVESNPNSVENAKNMIFGSPKEANGLPEVTMPKAVIDSVFNQDPLAVTCIDERERVCLEHRLGVTKHFSEDGSDNYEYVAVEPESFDEIGERVMLTRERIRQIVKEASAKFVVKAQELITQ